MLFDGCIRIAFHVSEETKAESILETDWQPLTKENILWPALNMKTMNVSILVIRCDSGNTTTKEEKANLEGNRQEKSFKCKICEKTLARYTSLRAVTKENIMNPGTLSNARSVRRPTAEKKVCEFIQLFIRAKRDSRVRFVVSDLV